MKKMLLLMLMVLASAAMAGDAEMKALLPGVWDADEGRTWNSVSSDGMWLIGEAKSPKSIKETRRWDIKDGVLFDIDHQERAYRILFLTEHECLMVREHHGYIFWWR